MTAMRTSGSRPTLAYTPVIGQATKRATDVAPTSVVRGQFEVAFAPGFNIASGFEDPDQVVEDLNEMTYTAFMDIADAEDDYTDSRRLDDRLGALEIPLLVIFGAEDQIYDAEDSIEPYRGIAGVQVEVLEGAGHSPQVEAPEETAALIEGSSAGVAAEERGGRRRRRRRRGRRRPAKPLVSRAKRSVLPERTLPPRSSAR